MSGRLTNVLLAILVALTVVGFALHQHESRQTRRVLEKLLAQRDPPAPDDSEPAAGPILSVEPIDEMAHADLVGPGAPADPRDPPTPADAPDDPPPTRVNDPSPAETDNASTRPPDDPPEPEPDDPAPVGPEHTPVADGPSNHHHPAPRPADLATEWQTFGDDVTRTIRDLLDGNYSQVVDRFDPDMAAALTEQRLAVIMEPIRRKHGAFGRVLRYEPPIVELPAHLHAFNVTIETRTRDQLVFTITLDNARRIAGLYVK
jgi:hypothetical protein